MIANTCQSTSRSIATSYVEARAGGEVGLEDVEAFLDAIVVQNALPYRKLFGGRLAIAKYNDHDVMMLGARV